MTSILTTLSHLGWHLYRACDLSKKSFDKVGACSSPCGAFVEKADDVIWYDIVWNGNWNTDMDTDTLMIV
jgi:hypothetical protein